MQSTDKRNKFEMMGQFVAISFNEQEVVATDETERQYQYDFAKVPLCSGRDEVVNALVKIKYPTFDKEIAAIVNGGSAAQTHSEWRVTAKVIADEFIAYRNTQN